MKKLLLLILVSFSSASYAYEMNDSHFHLTNYVQEGTPIKDFLKIMGNKTERAALFGIPLQQQWSFRVSEKNAPKYYLDTDSPLYYYSFTDAYIAMAYKSLSEKDQKRFDPMITGFNPTDMYAADHIKRVLKTFPGVFSGIGEFTIHKEFVSSKISGDVASLNDEALERIFKLAGQTGLLVLLHNDIHNPFAKPDSIPEYFDEAKELFKRHPEATIIWAHTGLGRVIQPIKGHLIQIEEILKDPDLSHVNFDISWTEVAKYVVESPESLKLAATMFNKYPDRFLYGTDEVAPKKPEDYYKVFYQYGPLWNILKDETKEKILKKNYARLFDSASKKVRKWEKENNK